MSTPKRSWVIALVLFSCLLASGEGAASVQEDSVPPAGAMLRLDLGMHVVQIRRISADASGRYLATVADDKTVRIWSLADGALLTVLRLPIGTGNLGIAYAVAMSPDGETVACGGLTGTREIRVVHLFERRTGRLLRNLPCPPYAITHLAFSPDGSFLAAALAGNGGVIIWDTRTWQPAGQDLSYGGPSYGLSFGGAGHLAVACIDGYVRLYDPHRGPIAKARAPDGYRPFSVAFSPDGSRLAVGYVDSPAIDILSGNDLSWLARPDTSGMDNGNVASVAWSPDGEILYAGGSYDQGGQCPLVMWPQGGSGPRAVYQSGLVANTVMDLATLPSGEVALGASDPAWAVLDDAGKPRLFHGPPMADFRDNLMEFLLSADGSTVGFCYGMQGRSPAVFSLVERTLQAGTPQGLVPPILEAPGLDVRGWRGSPRPTLNNQELALARYEKSWSLALLPDQSGLVLGADWGLYRFDAAGQQVWKAPAPGAVWAVNVSPDGRLVAAALGDGTIRWYGGADGKELLAFYPHPDGKRWVAWTPEGYYDASPGADDLLGWHVNRGPDKAADFYPASQFKEHLHKPEKVGMALR